jgi:hypothetical protein
MLAVPSQKQWSALGRCAPVISWRTRVPCGRLGSGMSGIVPKKRAVVRARTQRVLLMNNRAQAMTAAADITSKSRIMFDAFYDTLQQNEVAKFPIRTTKLLCVIGMLKTIDV